MTYGKVTPDCGIANPAAGRNISFLHFELPLCIRLLGFKVRIVSIDYPLVSSLANSSLVSTSCLNSPVGVLGLYHSPDYHAVVGASFVLELIFFCFISAIISVYDKTGLLDLAKGLVKQDVRLLASGGTAKMIREAGFPVE